MEKEINDKQVITNLFPDREIKKFEFEPEIVPGDVISFREEKNHDSFDRGVEYLWYENILTANKWKVEEVKMIMGDNGNINTILGMCREIIPNDSKNRMARWIRNFDSSLVEVVEDNPKYDKRQKLYAYTPFENGEILWKMTIGGFSNLISPPDRFLVKGLSLIMGNLNIRDNFTISAVIEGKRYMAWDSRLDFDFHRDEKSALYHAKNGEDRNGNIIIKSYDKLLYTIEDAKKLIEQNLLPSLKKCTFYSNDKPSQYDKILLTALMNDIGLTFENVENATYEDNKPKRPIVKKTKPTKKTNIAEMLKNMSEKEKQEMLKLLQNK